MFTFDDKIFACGGVIDKEVGRNTSSCYQYQPELEGGGGGGGKGQWNQVNFMAFNFPRQMASIAKSPTTGVVFVSGGFGAGNQTMEYLDRYTGQWMIGPNLRSSKLRHCVVVTDDLDMITIGGFKAGTSVESYDSFQDDWEAKGNMTYNDRHACAKIPGSTSEILIVGDRRQPTIYNFKTGVERLTRGGGLALNRGFGGLISVNDVLYVMGGEYHPTLVERFDSKSETFSFEDTAEIKHGRSRFGYTVVPLSWFSHLGCK